VTVWAGAQGQGMCPGTSHTSHTSHSEGESEGERGRGVNCGCVASDDGSGGPGKRAMAPSADPGSGRRSWASVKRTPAPN
jgi:hypothetical protein